jgi:hypothetical protein
MPALRTIKWGSPADKGKGGGVSVTSDRKLETLWLPGCNLQRLWDSDGVILTFGGGEWGNSGISDVFPPPWVLDLGVTFAKGAQPNVSTFGCDGQELEF